MAYEFNPKAEPEAVERGSVAEDNPPLPEPSVGDPENSPVSEAEVTEHGFPAINNAGTEPAEPKTDDENEEN